MSAESDALKSFRASIAALSRTVKAVHSTEDDEQPEPAVQLRTIFVSAWLGAFTRESYSEPFHSFRDPHSGLADYYTIFFNRLPQGIRKELPLYVSRSNQPMFHEMWTAHARHVSPISLVREGYETTVAETLSSVLALKTIDLLSILGIPERTVSRRLREHKKLTKEESDRVYRALDITRSAVEVFGDSELASRWLKEPNPALSGATPLSLLDTEPGRDKVLSLLGQIDHGVYA
jgi:putative toxin-antitoxin system antitoxin component (TIGR02293 family)